MRIRTLAVLCIVLLIAGSALPADENSRPTYQKPPKVVSDVLESPPTPSVIVSPTRDRFLEAEGVRHPSIADLAAPMLRLAGLRINPATNGRHHPPRIVRLHLYYTAGHDQAEIAVPRNAYLRAPEWSQDSQHFAFTNTTATGIEIWIGQIGTYTASAVPKIRLSAVLG